MENGLDQLYMDQTVHVGIFTFIFTFSMDGHNCLINIIITNLNMVETVDNNKSAEQIDEKQEWE